MSFRLTHVEGLASAQEHQETLWEQEAVSAGGFRGGEGGQA